MSSWSYDRVPFVGLICATALFALSQAAEAQAASERGLDIATEADERMRGYGDFVARLTMTLRDSDGGTRSREMTIKGLEVPSEGDKTLVVFDRPRDLQGTAVLTVDHLEARSEQWLYLPAIRRVRRIATSDQSDSFMGSQFTYEDMGSQQLSKYSYRYVRDETLGEVSTWVVERVPIDEESAYSKQLVWFDSLEYRMLRVDYFGVTDEPLKTLHLEDYQQYAGGQWRPGRMVMTDHATGGSTVLEWADYEFGTGLRDRDFDPNRLGR